MQLSADSLPTDTHPAGTNRGAEGGHRQNGKIGPPFVHKTLPVGNLAILTISATVTLCALLYAMAFYRTRTSLMWFSDGRRTQSNENPRFCPLGGPRGAPICRFFGFSGFRDSTSQISRAGVYSINRPLLKKSGRRLPENFRSRFFQQIRRAGVSCINRQLLKKFRRLSDNLTIPNRRPARDVVSNLRIHKQDLWSGC